MTVADHREIVAALRDVPGVSEADVEPDSDGGMGLLRLGLAPGVDEVEVATVVGRLLRERFGIGVDAERVQIVEDADLARPPVPTAPSVPAQRPAERPAISRMHLVSSGLDVTATVTLSSAGRTAVGEGRGNASQVGVQRAVANATLRAVEELLDGVARFELDHLEVTQLGSERTVLVALSMLSSRGTERLTGAAGVREDVRQAVIRSTLDALNRRFETLLS
ncbi:MAG: hypothetical protein LC789_17775 [Actinobacteria bacterium]|nr:hypothetical protein [Actinomycetota bacterium]MCA1720175.1 hypothetical protein [Actinomycetota bacterium]